MENFNYYTDEDRKKLEEDINARNQALSEIIANQKKEEQAIKDNYDSFGSRLTRALEVFGTGLKGENVAPVLQSQRTRLDNQLKQAQERYKNNRDTNIAGLKDLIARKDALAKFDYERDKNNLQYQLDRDKYNQASKLERDKLQLERDKLDWQKSKEDLDKLKTQEAESQVLAQKEEEKNEIINDLADMKARGSINPTSFLPNSKDEDISKAKLQEINLRIIKNRFGYEGKEAYEFMKNNPDLLPNEKDSANVAFRKYAILGYGLPDSVETSDDPEKINGKKVVGKKTRTKDGKIYEIYELEDGTFEYR